MIPATTSTVILTMIPYHYPNYHPYHYPKHYP